MFSRSVAGITEDRALPTLAQVLNTELMLPLLAQVAGIHLHDETVVSCTAQVLNHKLGQRCTIRYTLTRTCGERIEVGTVVGKVYGRQPLAERLYRRLEHLTNGPFDNGGPLRVPAPMMLVQDLGLVLQECVNGADLRHVLSADTAHPAVSLAGQWLARLHAAPAPAGLKIASLKHELQKVDRWCEYIASYLSTADAQRLRKTRAALHRLAGEMPSYEPVMIHKDFYYGNILWDGQRVWVLDFDELSIGDPALDIGHFLAHLETLAYRRMGRPDGFAWATPLFPCSYQERTALDLESRLPFYRAYTFLKLAATEVSRQQGEGACIAEVLTGLAWREVQGTDAEVRP